MSSDVAAGLPLAPNTGSPQSIGQKFRAFLIRYRVRISLLVFFALIAEDLLEGLKPHRLTNLGDLKSVLGLTLILGGLALRSWAAGILHKSREVTTSGPYALIRHPLYVGSFLMMIGFCLLIDDTENIWFVLGPFAFMYAIKLLQEERHLSEKFGARWQAYAGAVPRLLPRKFPRAGSADWNGRRWLNNREYRAVAATALGLVAVETWAVLR